MGVVVTAKDSPTARAATVKTRAIAKRSPTLHTVFSNGRGLLQVKRFYARETDFCEIGMRMEGAVEIRL
jgi:hypothetical protein